MPCGSASTAMGRRSGPARRSKAVRRTSAPPRPRRSPSRRTARSPSPGSTSSRESSRRWCSATAQWPTGCSSWGRSISKCRRFRRRRRSASGWPPAATGSSLSGKAVRRTPRCSTARAGCGCARSSRRAGLASAAGGCSSPPLPTTRPATASSPPGWMPTRAALRHRSSPSSHVDSTPRECRRGRRSKSAPPSWASPSHRRCCPPRAAASPSSGAGTTSRRAGLSRWACWPGGSERAARRSATCC